MDNKFIVKRLDIYSYRPEIPKPVVTSFGSISSRGTVLIYIEDADSAFGWGEIWSNFPTITTEYRAQLAASGLPSLLIDSEIREPKKFINALKKQLHVLCV
jgi:D-galactarolactone cycloisomerase